MITVDQAGDKDEVEKGIYIVRIVEDQWNVVLKIVYGEL